MDNLSLILLAFALLIIFTMGILLFKFFTLWLQAYLSKAEISIVHLIGMFLRKVNPAAIVRAQVSATQAKVSLDSRDLEAHFLAGGNVVNVVRSLIAADRANIPLDFLRAAAIDLAGRDVLDAVKTCVNPKVIACPDPAKGKVCVTAMAKDGIQVLVRALVTVRTNITQLVGGATEETIIARVGEGIISTIGSSDSYKDVLENPGSISKTVLAKGLDSGTSFEILSIDISDVDIGTNIGARLQTDQAEADKRVAQAKAEKRRAMAVAREQEQSADVVANRAKVFLAEAELPPALAQVFRKGNWGS